MSSRRAVADAPTASQDAADVRRGRADPVELVERALARLQACDADVGAFVHVDAAGARGQALQRAAEARAGGPLGPLHGVPVAVKDLFDVAGQVTRAGSSVPAGPPAPRDAVAVARLRAAGAVVVGRTRTHEFAWGLNTQHAALGGTRNPWDTARVPGGSSGGSAAAVAAGVVPLALGTDTGGSIRLPAAWCGLVGHKPTFGAVPMDGVLPLAPSLDHGGALVRDVADARLALSVLTGAAVPAVALTGLRLGVLRGSGLTPGVARCVDDGVARARLSATVALELDQPGGDGAREVYRAVQAGESLAWHRGTGRWPAHRQDYGPDVRARLEHCERVTPDELSRAALARVRLRAAWQEVFTRVDLVVMPVAPAGPPLTASPDVLGAGTLAAAVLPWTVPANLCGLPACSVPVGLDDDGLPVGMQVVGPPGADALVLALAERLC